MNPDFGEGWVSSPIDRWIAMLLKSGILFWIGGLVAWASQPKNGWERIWYLLKDIEPMQVLSLLFAIMMGLAITASLLKRFDFFVLRFLEGYYWSGWRQSLLRNIENWRIKKAETRRDELMKKPHWEAEEEKEFAQLDRQLMYVPPQAQRMPTRLGNLLRAIEMRPSHKYGLHIFVCWPRLWLLLPDNVKQEVEQARHDLDTTVQIWMWGVLFAVWSFWGLNTLWAIPVAIVVASLAYYFWMLPAARVYGELVESCFDLYRPLLYQASRFPMPDDPATEKEKGEKLTAYLWGRAEQHPPKFELYSR